MQTVPLTSVLHRDTLEMIVGGRTFARGQECFSEARVLGVQSQGGELAGLVKPQETGRPPYEVRIWVREDGLAFDCTCPMGNNRNICKHTVAVTLAHLEQEKKRAQAEMSQLRDKLMDLTLRQLLDGLLERARTEPAVLAALTELTDE
ncbi:MAG: SWIM zinc finger family protein [Archangium sp.]|nr:SWIM zinc finger family protein [Archangium sp.]